MLIKISATSHIEMEHNGAGKATMREASSEIDFHAPLDRNKYHNTDGTLNKAGLNALDHCFIQGLIGSIHTGHQSEIWDSAEHLRKIITELERGFIAQIEVVKP